MVSNGYSGLFWDGKSAPGGWGAGTTIVQIREVFPGGPFKSWRMITDPETRRETEKLISRETDGDDALARADPYTYPPGLQRRMAFDATQRLYDSLQRLIMIARELSHLFESAILDIIDPGGEVFNDIARHLLQLLPRPLAQLHPMNHIVLIIHLSGEYIHQGLRARSGDSFIAVEAETEAAFIIGNSAVLFEGKYVSSPDANECVLWDIQPDGKRFLMVKPPATAVSESTEEEPSPAPQPKIIVVLNWFEELKERVPVER